MRYEEITQELLAHKLDSTFDALVLAVDAEARALVAHRLIRPTAARAQADAWAYYAHDITERLDGPNLLTPDNVFCSRRAPTAWAIAKRIREARDRKARDQAHKHRGAEALALDLDSGVLWEIPTQCPKCSADIGKCGLTVWSRADANQHCRVNFTRASLDYDAAEDVTCDGPAHEIRCGACDQVLAGGES